MTSILDVTDWQSLAPFSAWSLVVWAVARAVAGSPPATALRRRAERVLLPRQQRIARLRWEIGNRKAFALRNDRHGERGGLLTEKQLAERQAELDALVAQRVPLAWLIALLDCAFCQAFWAACAVFWATNGWTAGLLPTALAQAALVSLAASLAAGRGVLGRSQTGMPHGRPGRGCPTCGGG